MLWLLRDFSSVPIHSDRLSIWPLLKIYLEKYEVQLLLHKSLLRVYSLTTFSNDCIYGISIGFLDAIDDLLDKVSGEDGRLVKLFQLYRLVIRWQRVLQRET